MSHGFRVSAKPKSIHAKSAQRRRPNAAWPDLDKRFFNEEGRRYNSIEFARLEFSQVASDFDEHTRGDNSDDTIEN
jgi:hypothetical protein